MKSTTLPCRYCKVGVYTYYWTAKDERPKTMKPLCEKCFRKLADFRKLRAENRKMAAMINEWIYMPSWC